MSEPRRYDEEQTSRILRRAMELRAPLPARLGELARGEGITLEQLVEAASEAGMEVDSVRRAAAELDAPEALRTSPFYGAPTRVVEERHIRRVVDPSEFDAFVDEVRREFGMLGVAAVTARAVTWNSMLPGSSATQGRRLSVSLVSRDAGTVLRVEEDLSGEAGGFLGASIGVGTLALIASVGALASVSPILIVAAPAVPAGMWMVARRFFRRAHDRRRAELIGLADRLAMRSEEPIR